MANITATLSEVQALNCQNIRIKQDGSIERADINIGTDLVPIWQRRYRVSDTIGLNTIISKADLILQLTPPSQPIN